MKKVLNTATNIGGKACFYLCFASMFIIVVMMVLMFVDSMLGLFVNQRITGSYELVQVMLSILVFSSWAYTQTVHGHINVVMFIRMFPQKLRFICYGLTSILSTVTMVFAAYAVFGMISDKFASGEATGAKRKLKWHVGPGPAREERDLLPVRRQDGRLLGAVSVAESVSVTI